MMAHFDEREVGLSLRFFLRCVGVKLDTGAAAQMRIRKKKFAQLSESAAVDYQIEYVEDEVVEDVDPAEASMLDEV